jgi:hypothetical protein
VGSSAGGLGIACECGHAGDVGSLRAWPTLALLVFDECGMRSRISPQSGFSGEFVQSLTGVRANSGRDLYADTGIAGHTHTYEVQKNTRYTNEQICTYTCSTQCCACCSHGCLLRLRSGAGIVFVSLAFSPSCAGDGYTYTYMYT